MRQLVVYVTIIYDETQSTAEAIANFAETQLKYSEANFESVTTQIANDHEL